MKRFVRAKASLNSFFLSGLWPGLAARTVLYISDYTLTLACARIYQEKIRETIVFSGSFELTPYFQRDINSLRRFSPRFVVALLFVALLLAAIWALSLQTFPELYAFALGSMILLQLAIHTRHLKNLFMFRRMSRGDAVRGRIEYSRPFVLNNSATELLVFAGFYAVLLVFVPTWFLLGGVASCVTTALKHYRLARQALLTAPIASQSQQA